VMYAGLVCETADTRTIFHAPRHPYTRALLDSMPRADRSHGGRLMTICGRIPILATPPSGCRFHPRCPEAEEACRRLRPEPVTIAPGHVVSCLKRGSQGIAA
jgi:oligopeptide/dipeptide ABC transporter ATP-binding protein